MKLTVMKPVEVEVDAIKCMLPFDDDDEIPEDFPGRGPGSIVLELDLNTGKVRDWPFRNKEYSLYLKVRDSGHYYLMAGESIVAKIEDYVPSCIPNRYADYVEFQISEDGTLKGWKPNAVKVRRSFFPQTDDE